MYENDKPEEEFTEHTFATLRWLGDQLPGGFLLYRADESQELLYVSHAVLTIFGCQTVEEFKELTGNTFKGLVHPDDIESTQIAIDDQIGDADNGNLDRVVYRIVRKDGEVRWLDDFGHFAQLPGYGDVYYVYVNDITDQHLLEEENKRRAEVIEGLGAEFASVYLLDLNTDEVIPYRLSKEYFQKIVASFAADEQDGPDWHDVLKAYAERYVIEPDRERLLQEMSSERIRERLEQESTYAVDYRRTGEGDDVLFTEMFISGITVSSSEVSAEHAVMAFRDVNEQTLRVQREMADRLRVEMELERERHANEVKSSFLFNISHDIRTPMNAIIGFSDLAQRHIDDQGRLLDYLAKIDESSRQLMALIDDMLEMSRIGYGRIEIKSEPANLKEELKLVTDLFRAQIEEKKLELDESIDLPDKEVLVDGNRFRRIMGNLLSNAVKFTPDGGRITLSARQKQVSESGYARFEFSVADNGIGMTDDFMKRMYEAFEREESSTKSGAIGTGLGLSITKSLLDMMGGSITVKSKKGEGSTFTVDLPLKFTDHVSDAADDEMVEVDHKAEGEYRILLVEDIEINRLLAETVLEEADFMVDSVPDGCDAVEAIRSHPLYYYDLVLMDIQMPVMNGYEATRTIRALNRRDTSDLPIVALSANAREEDKRMSIESGMDNHVAKPFDVAHLISTVNAHIAARNRKRGDAEA